MTQSKIIKRNFNYITMLRGLAILGVVFYHLAPQRLSGGFLGVVMFFVMSGFLMARSLDIREPILTLKDLFSSIKKRLEKLLPPLYLVMIIGLVFSLIFAKALFTDSIKSSLAVTFGYQNIYQILAGASYFHKNGNFNIFNHLWYISLQIQYIILFYGLNYLLDKFLNRKFKSLLYLILTIISFVLMYRFAIDKVNVTRIYYGPDTRMSALFIGAFFYDISKDLTKVFDSKDAKTNKLTVLILTLVLIVPFIFIKGESYFTYKGFMIIYTIITSILVSVLYLIEKSYFLNKEKEENLGILGCIFYYLGSRSYHIYLWQYVIQIIFAYKLSNVFTNRLIFIVIELVCVLLLSEITFRLFKLKFKVRLLLAILIFFLTSLTFASNFVKNTKEEDLKKLEERIEQNKKQIEEDNKKALNNINKNTSESNSESSDDSTNSDDSSTSTDSTQDTDEQSTQITRKDPYDFNFSQEELSYLKSKSITAIGDSISLDIDSYLRKYVPNLYLDGEVGRNMIDGPDVLQNIKNNHGLGDIIVVILGSNGQMRSDDMQNIMTIAENRPVFFVNTSHTQSWQDYINKRLKDFCDSNDNAYLVDWHTYAKDKSQLFAQDLVHPNVEGSTAYANIIARAILNSMLK